MQHQGHLVNRVPDIGRFDDRTRRHVTKHRKLLPQLVIERLFAAANQNLRLQANLAKPGDTLLRGLRL